jgi:hypothetical protein
MFNYFFKNLNTLFLTCALAFISIANAQEVRVIDNKGTIKKINKVTTDGTAPAPADSLTGDIWFDDSATPTQTKIYNGGNWIIAGAGPRVYTGVFVIERTAAGANAADDTFPISITGIPFQPSQVTFVAHANVASKISEDDSADNENNINNSFGTMNGFANASTDPIVQQVIYFGGSGASINSIGWFSSSTNCIGVRYGNQNADKLGIIKGVLSFTDTSGTAIADGFDIAVTYDITGLSTDNRNRLRAEKLVVLYTAYK